MVQLKFEIFAHQKYLDTIVNHADKIAGRVEEFESTLIIEYLNCLKML